MQFNHEQKQAITSMKPFVLVSAGAGSGKTRILTERFVHLCELRLLDEGNEAGATVDEIVAITFTEKAAREMKDRIRLRLAEKEIEATDEKARFFWKGQKEAVERAYISTFHSFCQRLLRQHAITADLIPQTQVLDEIEARSKKREIFKALFNNRAFVETAMPLLEFMSKQLLMDSIEQIHDDIREFMIGEDQLATLDVNDMLDLQCAAKKKRQVEVVDEFHQHFERCVFEFPSLDLLTKAQQAHIKRLTSVLPMLPKRENVTAYIVMISEAMPKRVDKKWNEQAPSLYELYTVHWNTLKEAWGELGGGEEIDERAITYMDHFVSLLRTFSKQYQSEKELAGALDFADLQQKAVALLNNEWIQATCRRQFRHMMIDEFQDTNVLQLTMLERINPKYRFIVGDQKQSIYRFRGANVRLMNEQEALAKKETWAETILMNTNYRTQEPIIEAVNELFAHVMASERKEFHETVYAPLKASRRSEREEDKRVELTILPKDEEQAGDAYHALANRIIEMIQTGRPRIQRGEEWGKPTWSDVAILIPARSHLLTLERALNDLTIPYTVSGGIGFYECQEVVDFMTILRWLCRPFEDIHLLALLRSPLCGLSLAHFYEMKAGLGEQESLYELVYDNNHPYYEQLPKEVKTACEKVQAWLKQWTPFRIQHSISHTLNELFLSSGLRSTLLLQRSGLQKVRNVEKLIHVISEWNELDLETILSKLEERIALSEKEGEAEIEQVEGDSVQIMTVHASKGLEFPIVCLPHLDRLLRKDQGRVRFHADYGIVFDLKNEEETIQTPGYPLVKDLADAEAIEESKRLFYVAMTRARDYLYMIGEETNSQLTWLQFIESAINEAGLKNYVNRTEASFEQLPVELATHTYAPPDIVEASDIPITFSVSEILLFINDPVQYFNQFIVGLPDHIKEKQPQIGKNSDSKLEPTLLGTLVHRACELRDHGLSREGAVTEALSEVEGLPNATEYEKEMTVLMSAYSEKRRAQLGEQVVNEWSFTATIEDVEIIGEIDKVVKKEGRYTIIDFKTNHIQKSGEEWIDYYYPQLYVYKIAYEQQTGEKIDQIALYVLRDEHEPLHVIPYSSHEEEMIRAAIRTMKTLREQQAGKEEYEKMREILKG